MESKNHNQVGDVGTRNTWEFGWDDPDMSNSFIVWPSTPDLHAKKLDLAKEIDLWLTGI